uniref:Uncharacterized protein n=1 Tax=Octopus bimaculoides TaxID=37653 RepID=A0A0L8G652_OCTBM
MRMFSRNLPCSRLLFHPGLYSSWFFTNHPDENNITSHLNQ